VLLAVSVRGGHRSVRCGRTASLDKHAERGPAGKPSVLGPQLSPSEALSPSADPLDPGRPTAISSDVWLPIKSTPNGAAEPTPFGAERRVPPWVRGLSSAFETVRACYGMAWAVGWGGTVCSVAYKELTNGASERMESKLRT
jgi:hypothetical protein